MNPTPPVLFVLLFLCAPLATQEAQAPAKVDFAKHVWPILEKNCIECHQTATTGADGKTKRPKGGVTLDSRQGIETSKQGKLVVAKQPDDSLLAHSISLPADDEDRMPPAKKGGPLAESDVARIRTWIEQGADFGTWTGAATKAAQKGQAKGKHEKGTEAVRATTAKVPGADLAPLDDATLTVLKQHFGLEPVAKDSPMLRVTCYGRESEIDDAALAQLAEHAQHVGELVLARTHVTDAGMSVVARCSNLTHLDLRNTKVGDEGCSQLGALSHLASLNLLGTNVGDAGFAALAACTELRQVYLWQTPVTAAAVVAFRERVPAARVVFAADLPEPMADAPVGGRARRR